MLRSFRNETEETAMQPPIALPKAPGWIAEFRAFVMRGNVVYIYVWFIIVF